MTQKREPAPAEAGIKRAQQDGVAVLTLSRPGARNALSLSMIEEFTAQVVFLREDTTVRCVVLAAEGPAFCAGHDLRELTAARALADGGRQLFEKIMSRCSALMQAIAALPQPVIAAVEGVATAAGCQLVATCDLAVAGSEARFCTPGVDIGLFCSTPMVALTRNVAPKHAMEMLLLGGMVGAEEAYRIGLINRVVPPGAALTAALDLARRIATKSPVAIRTGKALYHRRYSGELANAYEDASRTMVENLLSADAAEGIGAFLQKRPPIWPGA